MFSKNDKISVRQFQILLLLDMLGMGLVTLPGRAAGYAAQDAWLAVLAAALFAVAAVYLMTTAASLFPGKTFFGYSSLILTKPAAVIITLLFAARLIALSALELRLFGGLIKQTALPDTPFWAVCAVMLGLCAYAAAKGYETRARAGEILIIAALIPIVVVFVFSAAGADFSNALPVFGSGSENILSGGAAAMLSFAGIEFCLPGVYFLRDSRRARRGAMSAAALAGGFMAAVTLVCAARFGEAGLTRLMWPALEMLDTANIPGAFMERQDVIVLSFWIITVFALVNACLFFSAGLIRDVFGASKRKPALSVLIIAAAVFGLSFIPRDINETMSWFLIISQYSGVFFFFALPLALIITAKIRRIKDEK